jgi:hypothetical protein
MYEFIALAIVVALFIAVGALLNHLTRAPTASPVAKAPRPEFLTDEELERWLLSKDKQYGGGRFS